MREIQQPQPYYHTQTHYNPQPPPQTFKHSALDSYKPKQVSFFTETENIKNNKNIQQINNKNSYFKNNQNEKQQKNIQHSDQNQARDHHTRSKPIPNQKPRFRDAPEIRKEVHANSQSYPTKQLEITNVAERHHTFTVVKGDLFSASSDVSLAHCVRSDFLMGGGIAAEFKTRFKRVDELLSQKVKAGGCAVIQDGKRHLFYLVTKKLTSDKPNYHDFEASLVEMRKLCFKYGIRHLAMPKIGCGIDLLDWTKVGQILSKVFANSNTNITVYELPNQKQRIGSTQIKFEKNSYSSDTEVRCNGVTIKPFLEYGATTVMIN